MKTFESDINLDEITFEKRNKAYGAYFLRKRYKRNVVIAMFITLGFLTMSVGTPFVFTYMSPEVIVIGNTDESHVFDPMKLPEEVIPLPPLPPTPPVNLVTSHPDFSPVVVDDVDEKPVDPITDPENPGISSNDTNTFSDYTTYVEPPVVVEPEPEQKMVFKPFEVSELPEFIGGESSMYKYFFDNIKYSQEAKEMNIEGTVYVQFNVNYIGKIANVKVVRGVDPLLDKEALRVVESMPDWKPGKQSGNPVDVCMTIPIAFKLRK